MSNIAAQTNSQYKLQKLLEISMQLRTIIKNKLENSNSIDKSDPVIINTIKAIGKLKDVINTNDRNKKKELDSIISEIPLNRSLDDIDITDKISNVTAKLNRLAGKSDTNIADEIRHNNVEKFYLNEEVGIINKKQLNVMNKIDNCKKGLARCAETRDRINEKVESITKNLSNDSLVDINNLQTDLKNCHECKKELRELIIRLQTKNDKYESERIELIEKINTLEKENISLKNQLQKLAKENRDLRAELTESVKCLQTLCSKYTQLKEKIFN